MRLVTGVPLSADAHAGSMVVTPLIWCRCYEISLIGKKSRNSTAQRTRFTSMDSIILRMYWKNHSLRGDSKLMVIDVIQD